MKNLRMDNRSMMARLGLLLLIDAIVLLLWGVLAPSKPEITDKEVAGTGMVPMKTCSENSTSSFMIIGTYLHPHAG